MVPTKAGFNNFYCYKDEQILFTDIVISYALAPRMF